MYNKLKIVIVMAAIYVSLLLNLMKRVQEIIATTFKPMLDTKKNRLWVAEHEGIGIFKNVIFVFYKIPQYGLRNRAGKMLIMPTLPNPNAVVTAVLDLSRNHDADVTLMKLMRTKCTGNSYVITPSGTLIALDALILAYEDAHGAARAVTLIPLIAALNAIMLTFQLFANETANKSNSIVIIQSGGFHVKGIGGKTAQIWEALKSNVAGEILMTGVVFDKLCCFDWWYSIDGTNWVRMDPTVHAHTRMSGLVPNTFVWVRYQLVTAAGPQGFATEIKIQVPA